MKIKKLDKKLLLNKKTISHLSAEEAGDVKGGQPPVLPLTWLCTVTFTFDGNCTWDGGCSAGTDC